MISDEAIVAAAKRIRSFIKETPLEHSLPLSDDKRRVFLKLETLQYTGSFKVRGALNKLLSLSEEERSRGVVAASTGNHGAAVAYGLKLLNAKGIVFVPDNASSAKVANIMRLSADLRTYGQDGLETEQHARQYAKENRLVYLSPYNDSDVIAGQGSIAVELFKHLKKVDTVLIALGGGGLLSGIGIYAKSISPTTKIVACSPQNSAVMLESIKAGKLLDLPSKPTLSDGTAGGVEEDSITFGLCQQLIDEAVTVSEEDIKRALKDFITTHHMLIEGAAAVVLAAYEKLKPSLAGNIVLILCGANISPDDLKQVL